MSGIFFIAVVIGWLCAASWLTSWVTRRIKRSGVRFLTGFLMFIGLMVLPVIDEIIGGIQFRKLCEENTAMHVDERLARNAVVTAKLVPSEYSSKYLQVPTRYISAPIKIRESSYEFYVPEISQPIIAYKTYSAKGGWFIHLFGISEGNSPLIIGNSYCGPQEKIHSVFERLNVTTTNWKWK